MKEENTKSAEYELTSRAKQFLGSAKTLYEHQDWDTIHKRPTLHLIGHGLEVLLKGHLILQGQEYEHVWKKYEHKLKKLWNADQNEDLRNSAKEWVGSAWETVKNDTRFTGEFLEEDPWAKLEEQISLLSSLHGKETKYATRYLASPGQLAPHAGLLIGTFVPVAGELWLRIVRE